MSLREFVPVMFKSERTSVVYDDASSQSAVAAVLERCGFSVVLIDGPASEVAAQTRDLSPDLLVFDLVTGASRGLRIVEDLRSAAPACAVVLLAPFERLRESALDAGAYELISKDDLRDLERCVRRLTAELDATESQRLDVWRSHTSSSTRVRNGSVSRNPPLT